MKKICVFIICIVFISNMVGCDSSINTEARNRKNSNLINTVYYGYLLDYNLDNVSVGTFFEDLFDDCNWFVREENGNDFVVCNAKVADSTDKSDDGTVDFTFKVLADGRFVLVSIGDSKYTTTKQSEIRQIITTLQFQWSALKIMGR